MTERCVVNLIGLIFSSEKVVVTLTVFFFYIYEVEESKSAIFSSLHRFALFNSASVFVTNDFAWHEGHNYVSQKSCQNIMSPQSLTKFIQ